MKRLLVPACVLLAIGLHAQDDMPVIFETKLDHRIDHTGTGTEGRGYSYAASEKEITVFNNKTGAVQWTGRFKDLTPKLNKVDELTPFWGKQRTLLIRSQDRKGPDRLLGPQ
ncbi:MAG: hypothetical protein IPF64_04385 [Flavobacteriales bacterium]|nr:hypothetical protein [Flavobacteriales bacterium]